ncbi:uncharacterized protein LOC117642849 [Thrips palmi]|uniref:Uncharacterized protein LOC117642849 n=1 Tax=Thrips palmi TaxID=161013 RepID=A0A6P8ZKL9_THRPL|nr:uncharacterized protein LOC117642849 [Thrips palmi]
MPPLPPLRLLCVGALLLVWAVPVDPQWRVFRTASMSPSSYNRVNRDTNVPVSELRYPGYVVGGSSRGKASRAASTQPPRNRRQYRGYSKQSTFTLLRQLIAETANETRTAFNQIGDILGSQFADSRPQAATTTTTSTTPAAPADANSSSVSTEATSTTTTEAPYRISRQELFSILQRNSIGIGRVFRREYDQAMQDSKVNLNRFKQEFRLAVAPFLQPATTDAPSTTARR